MKSIITLLTIIFVSNCYSQNEEFWFPKGMPINPVDNRLKNLGVNQIEIFTIIKEDTIDKKNKVNQIIFMDYLFKYDSISRLSRIMYNFSESLDYEMLPNSKTVSIKAHLDTNFVHSLIYASDTILFSSWINYYQYDGIQLRNIEIGRPQRIEDGVFIREKIIVNSRIESIHEGGLLKEEKVYHDNQLFATKNYEYVTLEKNDKQYQFLTKIIMNFHNDNYTTEQIIRYSL